MVLASLGVAPFMRRRGVVVRAMGGKGEPRPASLGVALYVAFLLPLVFLIEWKEIAQTDFLFPQQLQNSIVQSLCACSLILLLWGIRNDRGRYSLATIGVMWGTYALMWFGGLRIETISLGFLGGPVNLPWWLSLPVTVLWLTVISSVVELLDGIDSVAPLAVFVGAAALLIYSANPRQPNPFVEVFAWLLGVCSLVAAILGRPGGRHLLGKNGAYLLGFWMGVLTVIARQKEAAAKLLTPLLVVVLVLAIILFGFVERSLGFTGGKPGTRRRPVKG